MIKENIVDNGKGWLNPSFLVVHSTANPGATAANHASLWSRSDYDYQVHYVSDWTEALHCVPDDRLCWHVGNANSVSIGLEICEGTNADDVRAGLEIAAKACAEILAAHGRGINQLVTHDWCRRNYGGTDHTDPSPYFDAWGITWDEFRAMVEGADVPEIGGGGGSTVSALDVRYRVCTERTGWLPEMVNHVDTGGSSDDFAGILGSPIVYLAIDMPGWYQVRTQRSGWLPAVRGYNVGDLENGCAGDGSAITGARCYYETQDPDATGWLAIEYQAHVLGSEWLPAMRDLTDSGGSSDDFAGNGGAIDGLRARLVNN